MRDVPALRLKAVNSAPFNPDGRYVLYWMIAFRRTHYNFAFQRAAFLAGETPLPAGRAGAAQGRISLGQRSAAPVRIRRHARNAARLGERGIRYYPYVEPRPGDGRGLLAALAQQARVVVTDDYPAFFLPQMVAAAGQSLTVRLESVDSNGLLPLRAADQAFPTAYAFRRFLQRVLPEHLAQLPDADPLPRRHRGRSLDGASQLRAGSDDALAAG